jgi:hypothetical protein
LAFPYPFRQKKGHENARKKAAPPAGTIEFPHPITTNKRRQDMSNPLHAKVAGLVWYRPEHYLTLKELFDDGHRLPKTFESWLEKASHMEAMLHAQGHQTVRAYIDPQKFPQWCRERGMAVDAKGRNAFANFVAMRSQQNAAI